MLTLLKMIFCFLLGALGFVSSIITPFVVDDDTKEFIILEAISVVFIGIAIIIN